MSDYFSRVERQLIAHVRATAAQPPATGASRRRSQLTAGLVPAVAVVVALAVAVGAVVSLAGRSGSRQGRSGSGNVIVLRASTASGGTASHEMLQRAVRILNQRVGGLPGHPRAVLTGAGTVIIDHVKPSERDQVDLLSGPGRLSVYDWEANVLLRTGRTAASGLVAQNPAAVTLSQGRGAPPGGPEQGAVPLLQAVRLASKQPPAGVSAHRSRSGFQYYLFAKPGDTACATALHGTRSAGRRCLLAGPAASTRDLQSGLPAGITLSDGQLLRVSPGTVVLQASPARQAPAPPLTSPAARFYVLKDNVAVSETGITHPKPSTGSSGLPDVTFGFTPAGQDAFEHLTAEIAHRASIDSPAGLTGQQNQHFAIALDGRLLSVPSIDFKQYPDGITTPGGADLTGAFTPSSAHATANLLAHGALPVILTPQSPV